MSTNEEDLPRPSEVFSDIVGPDRRPGNPFVDEELFPPQEVGGLREDEEEERRTSRVFSEIPESELGAPTVFSAGGAFAQGVKEGALGPLTIFGVDVDEETERPVAETLGKLTGIGISFIPLLKGTQIGLKGLGLVKELPSGVRAVRGSESAALALEGAVSGGIFEAGFAEEPGQIPQFAAIGATAGAVLDPVLTKSIRRVFGEAAVANRTGIEVVGKWGDTETRRVKIRPTILANERAVRPENLKNLDELNLTFRGLEDAPNALDETIAQMASAYRPGGVSVLSSRFNPGSMVPRLRETLPDNVTIDPRKTEEGLWEYLVADDGGMRSQLIAKIKRSNLKRQTKEKLIRRFMGEGEPMLSFEEGAETIREMVEVDVRPKKYLGTGSTLGFYVRNAPEVGGRPYIALAGESQTVYESLVHEYTHHINAIIEGHAGGDPDSPGLRNIMWYIRGEAPDDEINTLRTEMEKASKETVRRVIVAEEGENPFMGTVEEVVEESFENNPGYWRNDNELIARTVQIMFADPKEARRLAPNAVDFLTEVIETESPRLERILTREQKVIHDTVVETFTERRLFADVPLTMTRSRRKQFRESAEGVFEGMEVIGPDGQPWEFVRRVEKTRLTQRGSGPPTKEPLYRLRNPLDPDQTVLVTRAGFQRPTVPRLLMRNKRHVDEVNAVLREGPDDWVGISLRDPDSRNIVKGFLDLSNFDRTASLRAYVREGRSELRTGVTGRRPRATGVTDEDALQIARARGKDGVLVEDNGAYRAIVANEESVKHGGFAVPEAVNDAVDGTLGDNVIPLSFDNVARGLLRQAGVPERELDHFLGIAREQYGRHLRGIMDDEIRETLEAAEAGFDPVQTELEALTRAAGFKTERSNGRVRLVDAENSVEAASGLTESEAAEYAAEAGVSTSADLTKNSQIPTETISVKTAGGSNPPPPQAQAASKTAEDYAEEGGFTLGGLLQATQTFAARFTARENLFKRLEELGAGPLFSKIFRNTQRGIEAVDRIIANEAREALGGRTYEEVLKDLLEDTLKVPKDRRKKITEYIEFMTKGEVEDAVTIGEAGRGMTDQELRISRRISELGMAEDLPRLHATNRLINSLIEGKKKFLNTADDLEKREITDSMRQTIARLRQVADETPDDRGTIMEMLGLSQEERATVNIVENFRGIDDEQFSIFAVGRHARAPELPEGFNSGRQWFAARENMTEQELKVAKELQGLLDDAFQRSGLAAERQIAGYWPHMRKYAEQGFSPEDPFVKRALPDSYEWSHMRFRTGELDIYQTDPVGVASRYVRGLVMKQEFDPAYKQAIKALREEVTDGRAKRFASEYLDDLLGRPHTSFRKLDRAIQQSMKKLGVEVSDDFSRGVINTLLSLGYGATIPFRAALIARNYFQAAQTVAPITGMKDFVTGVKRATTKEGFQAARKAGVIEEFVAPLESAQEIKGALSAAGLNRRLENLVEKGFDWYKKADDWNRAVAYHAQRARLKRMESRMMDGQLTWDEFLGQAKVKTFSQPDQQRFTELWTQGRRNEAMDYLGWSLARKTAFRYGHANHPQGWNSVPGRLFGQFGTWPVQYKDFLIEGLTQGTTKDKAEFLAIHTAINLGTVSAGSAVGMDLWNWVSFPSLQYTGGPFAGMALNLTKVISGSDAEQAMAKRNLAFNFPSLEDPRSIFIPGSYAVGDLMRGMETGGVQGAFELTGFQFMRPDDVSPHEWLADLVE